VLAKGKVGDAISHCQMYVCSYPELIDSKLYLYLARCFLDEAVLDSADVIEIRGVPGPLFL